MIVENRKGANPNQTEKKINKCTEVKNENKNKRYSVKNVFFFFLQIYKFQKWTNKFVAKSKKIK